jgi:hypothetical protein
MCGNTPVKVPVIRGLKLGMAPADVKALFPESYAGSRSKDEVGFQRVHVNALMGQSLGGDAERTALKGLDSLWFEFLDDRLVSFEIDYDSSVSWANTSEFAATIARQFELPVTGWSNATLTCQGFAVGVLASGPISTLTVYEPGYKETIARRRADLERKKRDDFKP